MRIFLLLLVMTGASPALAGPEDWTASFNTCVDAMGGPGDLMLCIGTYATACAEEAAATGADASDGRCPDGEAALWESEMNRVRAEAEQRIAGYDGAVDALTAAQVAFMDYRNKACAVERLATTGGLPDVIEAYCRMQMTGERATALSWLGMEDMGE